MYTQNEKIVPIPIETEVKDAYLNYSMSVIVGRALPDVRDGLKPVHRRILYAMQELGLEHSKPYKKSARIVGECFIKDTLVLTSRGLVPIQDVERGEMVYTQAGLKTVTALYEMPARPLMRIELENGTVNTATRSQKFKVLTKNLSFEWKEACELTPQDYIVVKGEDAEIKQQALLGNLDGGRQVYCNENLAYLLGLFLSDGWIEESSGRICFYSVDKAVIDRVRQILQREFECAATIEARPYAYSTREGVVHHTGYQIRIRRRHVNKFLADAFCLHNADALSKKIPGVLFISPEPVVFAFVSGLVEGDGSIHSNRNVIHYGSVSQALISQLQILLQHHNIVSVQYAQDPVESHYFNGREIRNRNPLYCLEFRGTHAHRLGSRLNLAGRKAQKALDMLTRQQRDVWSSLDTIPHAGDVIFEYLSSRHLGSGWYLNKSGEKLRLGIKYPGGAKIRYSSDLRQKPLKLSQIVDWGILEKLRELDAPWAEFIDAVIEQKLYFMRVASVTEAPADITYDIQVADDHEFIANGMLVHNCLGKYHPHGDTAVYDTLVRMAQDFSLRYPLVEGQGNFGSVDGDSAAAMRYTEARLAAITDEMLNDLDKDTVNFGPNFDASLKEPLLLPAALPNLLVNGSSGIAVGMATNIPSHNLNEVADAIIYLLDNTDAEIKDLMKFIKGPDFATGGVICGKNGIKEAYTTGRGKVTVRGRASIEHQKNGKDMIVVTEIPYQVQKSAIIESAAALCDEKKIEGISDIRDESDKDGMRIAFELKRDVEPQIILNQLFKHTQLETTFGIINLALVENRPRVLNLKQILECYIGHRKVIIRRRTQFELDKALKRAHILEGLKIALKFIDKIIKVIKTSKTVPIAKENLMKEFGLSDLQAQAILEMQLQRLTALEQDKIEAEYLELLKKIETCRAILASEKKVEAIIKDELGELKKKYGDERRTDIVGEVEELEIEDLIADEDVVVTVSHNGYIKRLPVSAYRKQKRGGTGATGAEVKEEDFIEHLFVASTKDYLLVFTDQGQVHWLKVYEIPQASKQSKGKAVVNLLELKADAKISSTIPIREFSADKFLVMVTKLGQIKKTQLDAYSNPRKGGIIGITLDKGDELISVQLTDGKQELLIGTRQGKAVRFSETLVRDMGRSAKGVRGISLAKKDEVISMIIAEKDSTVLTVTELGFAKRTPVKEYRLTNRGGKGIINIKVTTKNGEAVGLKAVSDNDELMVITQNGIFLRCAIKDIRTTGRAAQGVRLIKLQDKDRVACIAPVIAEDSE